MANENIKTPKTESLREYIDNRMNALHTAQLEWFDKVAKNPECLGEESPEAFHNLGALIELQEIVYLVEYGFITEMGNLSLKEHLTRP